jgi:hypothetical protein
MEWLKLLVAPVADVINGIGDRRLKKKELEEARHMKTLQGIQDAEAAEFLADMKRTEDLSTSWKDEYITIVVSIPAILCFIPGAAWIVNDGFKALGLAPDWYQYLLIAVFSVGAGVPLASKTVKTIKGIQSNKHLTNNNE